MSWYPFSAPCVPMTTRGLAWFNPDIQLKTFAACGQDGDSGEARA